MRPLIALVLGLIVGIAGATLFIQSLPPEEGSEGERAARLEQELGRAQRRIIELEAIGGRRGGGNSPGDTTIDRARRIAQRLRDGEKVSVDELFDSMKPMFRDLAPVFDRIRLRDQQRHFDRIAGEMARKYDLDPAQQAALEAWLDRKAEENAERFSRIMTSEQSRFIDMVRASRDDHPADGLDAFMEETLEGEALERYRDDRMAQRVESVQQEADRKVTRLDAIATLDESQKDQVFAIMARGAQDFDPSMRFDGLGEDTTQLTPGQSRDEAILSILRQEQQEAYLNHLLERRADAEAELDAIGLTIPDDWDLFEEDLF